MKTRALLLALVLTCLAASCSESSQENSAKPPGEAQAAGSEQLIYLAPADESDPDGPWVLMRVDDDDAPSTVSTPPGGDVHSPDVKPGGGVVVYGVVENGEMSIWSTDLADEGAEPMLILDSTDLECPRWFPGSNRVVLLGDDDRIEVLDLSTGESSIARPAKGQELSCVDPVDESRLVYAVSTGEYERPDLWMLDTNTGDEDLLGSVAPDCLINNPDVSPDARVVLVDAICDDVEGNGLWTIPVAGGEPTALLAENPPGTDFEDAVQYWEAQWNHDGSSVAYHRSGTVSSSIHVVASDGTRGRAVAPAFSCCPTFAEG